MIAQRLPSSLDDPLARAIARAFERTAPAPPPLEIVETRPEALAALARAGAAQVVYGKQAHFILTQARHAAFVAGIGSGKSVGGAIRAHRAALGWLGETPIETPNLGMITAPTMDMIRKATLRDFLRVAGDDIVDHNKNEKLLTLRNGSEIYYASTQEYEHLRGPSIRWWWGDEHALDAAPVRDIMVGRLRQFGLLGYYWVTTTPRGRNHVWKTFVQEHPGAFKSDAPDRDRDYCLIKAHSRDNVFQQEEVVADWERTYTGDYAAQELEGEFVAFEGLIYNEFDRLKHIRAKMPEYPRAIAGVDWGFANPGVIVVCGIDGDGRMGVVQELYQRQMRVEEWASAAVQLRGTWGIMRFYCDPANPDNIRKFVEAGLPAEAANNTVQTGIQMVKNRLAARGADGVARLTLTQDAVNLIDEFESYQWAVNRHGLRDEPIKAKDHALDALRYAVMGVDHPKVKRLEARTQTYA